MNYFKALHPTLRLRLPLAAVALLAGALIAGCGSGGSSTITIGNENTTDNALIKSGEKSGETAATTPTSGPLSKKPVVVPPGGAAPTTLVVKELIVGTGSEAKAGDKVTVNYVGVLFKNGKEFDSSWKRNEPFAFTLGRHQVIEGWDKGVAGMKVGGRRELIIPSAQAYGATGSPPTIPPNSALVFVVDLLGV